MCVKVSGKWKNRERVRGASIIGKGVEKQVKEETSGERGLRMKSNV